jgi:hypothetical protein
LNQQTIRRSAPGSTPKRPRRIADGRTPAAPSNSYRVDRLSIDQPEHHPVSPRVDPHHICPSDLVRPKRIPNHHVVLTRNNFRPCYLHHKDRSADQNQKGQNLLPITIRSGSNRSYDDGLAQKHASQKEKGDAKCQHRLKIDPLSTVEN